VVVSVDDGLSGPANSNGNGMTKWILPGPITACVLLKKLIPFLWRFGHTIDE
jgi:hypothetical protein